MPSPPFQPKELEQAAGFHRLLGRQPKRNALIERSRFNKYIEFPDYTLMSCLKSSMDLSYKTITV